MSYYLRGLKMIVVMDGSEAFSNTGESKNLHGRP